MGGLKRLDIGVRHWGRYTYSPFLQAMEQRRWSSDSKAVPRQDRLIDNRNFRLTNDSWIQLERGLRDCASSHRGWTWIPAVRQ